MSFFGFATKKKSTFDFGSGLDTQSIALAGWYQLKGYIGECENRKSAYALEKIISDIPTVIESHTRGYLLKKKKNPTAPTEEFLDWLPRPKKSYKQWYINPKSLPCTIKACYSWGLFIDDKRRNKGSFLGIGGKQLTGCKIKCFYLPGRDAIGHTFASLATKAELKEIVGEDEMVDHDSTKVKFDERVWEDWRLSYRGKEPEKRTGEDIRKSLGIQ